MFFKILFDWSNIYVKQHSYGKNLNSFIVEYFFILQMK